MIDSELVDRQPTSGIEKYLETITVSSCDPFKGVILDTLYFPERGGPTVKAPDLDTVDNLAHDTTVSKFNASVIRREFAHML